MSILFKCAPFLFVGLVCFLLNGLVLAQSDLANNPVEEADGFQPVESGRLSELFYRIQVLQQELKELRGTIEEQSYLIKRLERSQKEQYLDLDGRLLELDGPENRGSKVASIREDTGGDSEPVTEFSDEREAYQYAFDLMRNRRYEESLLGFEQIIVNYPNGQYTPNAFYWIGELYLAQSDHEQSRQAFIQVINLYPDHQKVPDAMYKLGVVYFALGDNQAALKYLEQVQRDYPESSAAGLASRYSAEIQ